MSRIACLYKPRRRITCRPIQFPHSPLRQKSPSQHSNSYSSLSEQEIQIVLLTDAVANSSAYAVAFHTALALNQGVSSEETAAIRARLVPKDPRFGALSTLAKTLIEKRGHLSAQELDAFLAAGFTKEQILEVIAIVAASTITNYAGTIADPPLEDQFQPFAWRG